MPRLKIAMYWLSSCGGCDESILDLGEYLLDLNEQVDIVFWPIAIDVKYHDLKKMPDNSIDFSFLNGAVRTEEHIDMARLFRLKSKMIIAHGSCAHMGGVLGLSGFYSRESLLNRAYPEAPSNTYTEPIQNDFQAPAQLTDKLLSLSQIIDVDYYLPGCPTPPELFKNALLSFLSGEFPEKGTVFGERKTLCHSCPLIDSKPERIEIKKFQRIQHVCLEPGRCFLDQGLICLGPATRGGCKAQCILANIPCRGCFGPLDNVKDHGARILSMLSSLIDSSDPEEIESIAETIPDIAGLFYRYSLASSIIKKS